MSVVMPSTHTHTQKTGADTYIALRNRSAVFSDTQEKKEIGQLAGSCPEGTLSVK
jgi:hypothetical protein